MTTRVTKSEDPMDVASTIGLPLADLVLTDEMEAAYIKAGGVHCPYCKADDVQGDQFDVEWGEARQPMSCNVCGATWVDAYKLVGVIP